MTNPRTPLATPEPSRRDLSVVSGNAVPTVYDSRYLSGAAPLTSTTKAGLVMDAHAASVGFVPSTQPADVGAVWAHIAQWHLPAYVDAVRSGRPHHLATSQGFQWSEAFAESVARIWYGQHFAQRLARVAGRAVLHPVSGAHHAVPEAGGGYCTFNYVVAALADIQARDAGARCAVIDLDAHWGNGTIAMIVRHSLPLHTFDIHGGAATRRSPYACGGGESWEYGANDISAYWEALANLPAFIATHGITDAVYLAGMDPFHDDPVGGIDGMTESALATRDLFVIGLLESCGVSTVVNFAGGYVPAKVVDLHGGTIRAMRRSRHARALLSCVGDQTITFDAGLIQRLDAQARTAD